MRPNGRLGASRTPSLGTGISHFMETKTGSGMKRSLRVIKSRHRVFEMGHRLSFSEHIYNPLSRESESRTVWK